MCVCDHHPHGVHVPLRLNWANSVQGFLSFFPHAGRDYTSVCVNVAHLEPLVPSCHSPLTMVSAVHTVCVCVHAHRAVALHVTAASC